MLSATEDMNRPVSTFRSYAEFCIRRRLYSAIKSAALYKHTPLNDYVSIEYPQFDKVTQLLLLSA